jgi:hypothetical protein
MATPRGAPELVNAQATPEATVNEQIRHTEAGACHFIVADDDLTAPPGSCSDGASYIIAATATGAWTGKEKQIATALGTDASGGWTYHVPAEGFTAYIQDENARKLYDGADWVADTSGTVSLTLASTVAQSGTPVATSVGFLGSPQMADQDDYTLALTDAGGHYYHVSGTPHTLTIPANSSIAFPIGTVIGIVNENGAGNITLAITSDTLRWGSSTGSRTIAANGTATLLKVSATVWRLTGDGIT